VIGKVGIHIHSVSAQLVSADIETVKSPRYMTVYMPPGPHSANRSGGSAAEVGFKRTDETGDPVEGDPHGTSITAQLSQRTSRSSELRGK
jgi:hypothetical protein